MLRRSMEQFPCEDSSIEVLTTSRYAAGYLNRHLITVLSTLGVKNDAFQALQTAALDLCDKMLTSPEARNNRPNGL